MEEGLINATDFQIEDLTLVSSRGIAVNLSLVLREMTLFEDIFSNVMSGNLFIEDTQNLINTLPIVGAEYLTVHVSKPSSPWKIKKVFRVYKISDRKRRSGAVEDYIIHFCSEEALINESVKISKAYKGTTASQIVKDIATTYLNINPAKFPAAQITQTNDPLNIVIPYWTPLYTINWVSRMARTGQAPGGSFFFFEDGEGFRFMPLELLAKQKPLQVINFSPVNIDAGDTKEKNDKPDMQILHESAQDYELVGAPDTLRSISSGMYAGRLTRVNPFEHKITISTLDGGKQFRNTGHLNQYPFMQKNRDRSSMVQNERFDSFFRVSADQLRVETWLLQRNAYVSGLHGFQLKIVMPGNMYFRVGQVVTVNMPAATAPTRDKKPLDELYSGNYLITSVRHKFDRTKYICVMEVSKDSLAVQLPGTVEGNPKLNEVRGL